LKEEAQDLIKWRNRFRKGCGPVVWQITDEWIRSSLRAWRFRIWKRVEARSSLIQIVQTDPVAHLVISWMCIGVLSPGKTGQGVMITTDHYHRG
jgi:hypothetical protein